jgi:5-methylcytosine-specific restriction endonuclease McrA
MPFTKNYTPWNKGKKASQNHRDKMSIALKGKKAWNRGLTKETNEIIKLISEKNIGRQPWNKGLKGFLSGEKNNMWKGGRIKKTCLFCEKEFEVYPVRKDRAQFCSCRCHIAYQRKTNTLPHRALGGKEHYNWKGGISKEPYGQQWTETLKTAIRQRDNYKCQACGCPEMECSTALSIHHINEIKDDMNPENLISLCRSCHGKIHFDKIKLTGISIRRKL